MNSKLALTLVSSAMLSALCLIPDAALAQASPASAPVAKTATKAPAKAASKTAAKPATKRTPAKKVVKAPPAPAPLPDAPLLQLEAAKLAYLGNYDCEFKQTISIEPHADKEGYIDVHWLKETFTMRPVLSSTGALRLEDVTGRTLMIQIANKSMLLDVKIGQRLVDDCVSPEQRELMAHMAAERAAEAASGVTPADNGLGLAPTKN